MAYRLTRREKPASDLKPFDLIDWGGAVGIIRQVLRLPGGVKVSFVINGRGNEFTCPPNEPFIVLNGPEPTF